MIFRVTFIFFCVFAVRGNKPVTVTDKTPPESKDVTTESSLNCTCGIFLSKLKKLTDDLPEEDPVIIHEISENPPSTCNDHKWCTKKCLSVILKHLPNSQTLICSALDRDCHKERAHLLVKSGSDKWSKTGFAGREYCCKDNLPYKC